MTLESDRELAERLVRAAGGIALELRGNAAPEVKAEGPTDIVTEADRRAEALLLDLLREERPGDGVVGEEGAQVAAEGARRWVLDPVDGTHNYARGVPVWCSAVALLDADGPLACAVHDPERGELFSAARGEGATLDGAPLRIGGEAALGSASVAMFIDVRRRDPEVIAAQRAGRRAGRLAALPRLRLRRARLRRRGPARRVAAARLRAVGLEPGRAARPRGGRGRRGARALVRRVALARAGRRAAGAHGAERPTLSAVTETRDTAGALTSEEPPSLTEAIGGPLGAAESAVPAAAYVAAYTLSGQDTTVALIVAGALGVLFALARIARGQTVQYALSGLVGLALSAWVVSKTGRAEDFFLPGLLANAAYAAGYLISILVGWPLLGVIVGAIRGTGMGWREDPELVRAYSRASWIWVGLFSLRLAVQLPLYLASALTALGVARVAMGIPLFAVGIWLSWLILRPTLHEQSERDPAEPASS